MLHTNLPLETQKIQTSEQATNIQHGLKFLIFHKNLFPCRSMTHDDNVFFAPKQIFWPWSFWSKQLRKKSTLCLCIFRTQRTENVVRVRVTFINPLSLRIVLKTHVHSKLTCLWIILFSLTLSPHTPLQGLLTYNRLIRQKISIQFQILALSLSRVYFVYGFLFSFSLFLLKFQFILSTFPMPRDCSNSFFSFNERDLENSFFCVIVIGFPRSWSFEMSESIFIFYGAPINKLWNTSWWLVLEMVLDGGTNYKQLI